MREYVLHHTVSSHIDDDTRPTLLGDQSCSPAVSALLNCKKIPDVHHQTLSTRAQD
jgi:hypothetical protein